MLFIHGAAGNHRIWQLQLNHFGKMYRAIAIDLMGHGESEISIPPTQISMEEYTDFVNEFLAALGIEKVALIGHSMGGAICIQFCLDFPEKVGCLGLINTGAKLGVNPYLLSALRKNFRETLEVGFIDISGQRHREAVPLIVEEIRKEMLKTDPAIGFADFWACNRFDSRKRLSEIKKPTLVVGGTEDLLTPPWFQHYLHEKIENSTLKMIEGVGHFSMVEKPDEFNENLTEFLRMHLQRPQGT